MKKSAKSEQVEQMVSPQIRKILSKEIGFDSAALLASIVDHWGGPNALAGDLYQDYRNAKPGSMTRQRIIEMISRLTVAVTNQGAAQPKDINTLTEDELLDEAERILKASSDRTRKKTGLEGLDLGIDERPDA